MAETPEEPLPQEDKEDPIDLEDYSYPEIEDEPVVGPVQADVPAVKHRDKSKGTCTVIVQIDLSLLSRCKKDLLFVF